MMVKSVLMLSAMRRIQINHRWVLELVFDEAGNLELRTSCEEGDFCYDEIGSVLKIKQLRNEKI